MAANTGKTQKLNDYPFPFTTEGAEVRIKESSNGNKIELSFLVDRDAFSGVLERWTWNDSLIIIRAGDRDITISFPPIKEQVSR